MHLETPHAGPGVEPGRKGAGLPSFSENAFWNSLSYVAARRVPEVPPLLLEWWRSPHVISPEAGTGQVVWTRRVLTKTNGDGAAAGSMAEAVRPPRRAKAKASRTKTKVRISPATLPRPWRLRPVSFFLSWAFLARATRPLSPRPLLPAPPNV